MRQIIVIAHNIRSIHNVGSLFRTAEGLGVNNLLLTGYTPYLSAPDDERLPHARQKIDRQLVKTSLGAEKTLAWAHASDPLPAIADYRNRGFTVAGLEQAADSVKLSSFAAPDKLLLILGNEVTGIPLELLAICDTVLEIPMLGHKESFNVVQAAAMALYHCQFC